MATPDGGIYTFPSRDNTGEPKQEEWGPELPFVEGGKKTKTASVVSEGSRSMKGERSAGSTTEERNPKRKGKRIANNLR